MSAVLHEKQSGFFIEFGAGDGVFHSNTYFFEKKMCWTGFCVEPSKYVFEKLVKNRPRCTRVWGAICSADREQRRYTDVLSPTGWTGWSGFSDEFSEHHKAQIAEKERTEGWRIESYMVTCHTIESLLRDYGPEGLSTSIDYLSIDTEGSEQEIIDAIDFGQVNVSGVVQVEANLGEILQLRDAKAIKKVQAIRDRMLNFDFHGPLTARSGLDEFYVHKQTWKGLPYRIKQLFVHQKLRLPTMRELAQERADLVRRVRHAAAAGAMEQQQALLQQEQMAYMAQWMRMTLNNGTA